MVTIKAADAHNDIGSLWDKAKGEPVMIESAGKPVAVVFSAEEYSRLAAARPSRQFGCGHHLLGCGHHLLGCGHHLLGCGHHLLSGAGINVNDLFATPVDEAFSGYKPDSAEVAPSSPALSFRAWINPHSQPDVTYVAEEANEIQPELNEAASTT